MPSTLPEFCITKSPNTGMVQNYNWNLASIFFLKHRPPAVIHAKSFVSCPWFISRISHTFSYKIRIFALNKLNSASRKHCLGLPSLLEISRSYSYLTLWGNDYFHRFDCKILDVYQVYSNAISREGFIQ